MGNVVRSGEWDSGKTSAFLIKKTGVASLLLPLSSVLSVFKWGCVARSWGQLSYKGEKGFQNHSL